MGRSIRNKKLRANKAIKRDKLQDKIAERQKMKLINMRKRLTGKSEEELSAEIDKEVEVAQAVADGKIEDCADAKKMDFNEDDFNEFGQAPHTRRSKQMRQNRMKKIRKKKGVLGFLENAQKASKAHKGSHFGKF